MKHRILQSFLFIGLFITALTLAAYAQTERRTTTTRTTTADNALADDLNTTSSSARRTTGYNNTANNNVSRDKDTVNDRGGYGVISGNYELDYEDENNGGFGIPVKLGYDVNEYLGLEFETGWHVHDFEEAGRDFGHLHIVPLLVNVPLRYPVSERFVPYIVGGTGVFLFGTSGGDNDTDIRNGTWGFKTGAGFDYYVNDNTAINFESGFFFVNDPKVSQTVGGTRVTTESDVDSWYIGSGLKFKF